ncbi:SDR family oxidoreductase [Dyadobacter chenwenxiniae]|uniref:SDR family oxidoreductase n=1 Tax=Dyadobacter chenwenxiniae TaxID=2906456 RepID=A0A9X1PHJ6_9BACT|nr:SDR family oxidoreductase [Dyadobacter chenwenxiniae]MCF0060395.1 SDR family oxidoreductase [Dyadobacter chenwenxiniae]UON86126.1 SDR family oxidoreductase [Dyadobacter chenwenxiniae]
MEKLKNKVAVITGGNSGMGLATAKLFATEGAKVAITGRNEATLKKAVSEIGNNAIGVRADVLNLKSIVNAYAEIAARHGKFDVLIVNAGVYKGLPLADFTEELFDELVDINFKGAFFSVQKALPFLNDGASVVMTSSVSSESGAATASVYGATKAAIRSLARGFSADLLERNIRVNVLSPGPIETPIFDRLGMPQENVNGIKQYLASGVPLKRLGTIDEMAKGFLYLASDDSSFMLAGEIVLDGGIGQM